MESGGSAEDPAADALSPRWRHAFPVAIQPAGARSARRSARRAKREGEVLVSLVVGEHAARCRVQVAKPLGMGLDEKAIEAVSRWTFKPGMKDGKPVPVMAQVAVRFRLL